MEKIDIILWIIGAGFAMNFALMLIMWNSLNKKIDDADNRLSKIIDKLSEKVEDIDRRLCRIEGSLATTGHCLFSQSKPELKVE